MRRWQLWLAGVIVSFGVLFSGIGIVSAQTPGGAGGLGIGSAGSAPTTCSLEGIGWIVCPVLRSAAKAADYAFTFISQSFLGLEIELFNSESGTRQAWGVMLNVANVSFVIALLWVIYGHLTGHAAGTYNIKRMLPRLIIGAIMVQASFFICQLLVDISNVIGASINSVFAGITSSIGQSGMPLASTVGSYDSTVLTAIASSLLGNTQVAWVLLAPLAAIVLLAALICSVLIVVLIVRKTLVMALILLSPLAFVAYLLPSTEHLFSRWLKLFTQTLLLFPIIAILLGTGQVVSASIIKAGNGVSGYKVQGDEYVPVGETSDASATLRLVAAGAAVLPLAGTWWAFKAAVGGLDAAAVRVKRGSRRSVTRKAGDAAKREQAAQARTSQTMMQKGLTRIQQISSLQDTRGENGIANMLGNNRRPRKKSPKTPEQAKFDTQVQKRLEELRTGTDVQIPAASPQLLYSQALEKYTAAQNELGADEEMDVLSSESINLKASEAYLLESIAKHPADQGGERTSTNKENNLGFQSKTDSSSSNDAKEKSSPAENTGNRAYSRSAPTTSLGAESSAADNPVTSTGAVVGVPIVIQSDDLARAQASPGRASYSGGRDQSVGRPGKPNKLEEDAKARAAKYVAQAQESLLDQEQLPDEVSIRPSAARDNPELTPTLQKINEMSASVRGRVPPTLPPSPGTPSVPSTLRAAETSTQRVSEGENGATDADFRINHSDTTTTDKDA